MYTEDEEKVMNPEGTLDDQKLKEEALDFTPHSGTKKKSKTVLKCFFSALLGFTVGACLVSVLLLGKVSKLMATGKSAENIVESLTGDDSASVGKLGYLITLIKTYYYKDVNDEDLVNGIYKGVFESLGDPYSEYYTAQEYKDLMVSLTGNYAGIGALLSKSTETGVVTISKVYANTPAEEAGLMEGDIIVAADGNQAVDLDLDQFVSHIRGEAGTAVTLTIERNGETKEVIATRANISTPTVEHKMLDDKTGYIEISQFTEHTAEDFKAAMEDLKTQGMESVVFDLRNNGGGLLNSVVEILDYLLPEGTVVYTMDKAGNRDDFTSDAETFVSMPICVLVNGNTASASEIFTGAIRDYKYGTIIGTNTFGKGIVQSTIPLSDGSAIKITTESYYTPSGECIHGVGIAPDIELEYEFLGGENDTYSVELDNQIQKALEVIGAQ